MDDAADLLVAADDRVNLPGAGGGGEVRGVLLQGLELALRLFGGDLTVAAHALESTTQGVEGASQVVQNRGGVRAALGDAGEQHLGGDVTIAEFPGELLGGRHGVEGVAVELRVGHAGTLRGGVALHEGLRLGPHCVGVDAGGGEDRLGNGVLLLEEGHQQVAGTDVRVPAVRGVLEGGLHCFAGHGGWSEGAHGFVTFLW